MTPATLSAGDDIPSGAQPIEVRVPELARLFNAIDPSPFRERDLDPAAEEFIIDWSRDLPADAPLALIVYLSRSRSADEVAVLRDAVRENFERRAVTARRTLRELFRRGRVSLLIGLGALAASVTLGDLLRTLLPSGGVGSLLSESILIGGWVAMWRPLEIFLYDWWPIRADERLFLRLRDMPVRIVYEETAPTSERE
ncbi:MAG: hypothetical protein DIU54_001285 [Acidobacteriota bacterium]|jgi:hypothetical protein|nr:MAG: hypothetical protein DIU54_01345 [Acidobacteriota bacterium]